MPNWKKVIVSGSDASLNSLNVVNGITGSLFGTASYSSNGGVTQLLAGPNVTLSPTNGLGQVTVSSTSGGGGFNTATGSYGSFYDTTTQTNPVGNIPRSMSLNTTDITNGVSVSGSTNPFNTYIKTENAGVYNIQFSAQVDKTDAGNDEIIIWLRKNGTDLTDTATTLTLSGNSDKKVAAWNWFANSAANDYYQIIWQSADTDLRLLAEPADGHPGIPSVIVTANRVDQFLSNTGSFSGSFTGPLTGTASYASQALNASTASYVVTANTASYVLQAVSASFATTASYSNKSSLADNATNATNATTASYVLQAVSSSFATNASTASYIATASYALSALSSSYAINASSANTALTASYVSLAQTASYANLLDGLDSTAFAQLALANRFTANQVITGSLTATGDIITQGNIVAQQYIVSSSVAYFTESFSSGSTKFGNSLDDTHQFTGSVNITGSLNTVGDNTLSGSLTIYGPNGPNPNIKTQNSSLILEGNAGGGGTSAAQLRITSNPGAWTDNILTSYFQIRNSGSAGFNNNVTFQGGTYGTDAPFDRLQFASYYTSFNNGAYGTTPVPTASFEIINSNSGTIPLLQLKTLVGQTSNYVNITSGSTTGNVFNITKDGVVAIGTTNTSTEANLFLGAKGTDEGGQLIFQKGTSQASASMLDNYQNTLRVLTGTDTTSVRMDLELSHVTQNLRIFGDVIAYASSDKRLKTNIQPIENPLDKLNQISGYTFDWDDKITVHGHEGHDIGVIAQEIEEVLPEVVTTRDNGYKAVKYEKIIPLLIEAIKELKAEVDSLKSGNYNKWD